MKWFTGFFCAAVFLISCSGNVNPLEGKSGDTVKMIPLSAQKDTVKPPPEKPVDILANDSIRGFVGDDPGELTFKLVMDTSENLLLSIRIFNQKKKIIQRLKVNKTFKYRFELRDANFDGYRDIFLVSKSDDNGLNAYWVYNYNPDTKEFGFNKELSDVMGLEIDPVKKSIIFWDNDGANGNRYQYVGTRLTQVEKVKREDYKAKI